MKVKIVLLVPVLVFLITVLASFNTASAAPSNWNEVTSFTGSGSETYTTDYFTCDHVEWRIRWEYVPDSNYPEYAIFSVMTYPQGEDVLYVSLIMKSGSEDTSGVSYIHNNKGTFYMEISFANTQSYTIIVEQDLYSIPEFPSFLILPLFMIATLLTVIVYRRRTFYVVKET